MSGDSQVSTRANIAQEWETQVKRTSSSLGKRLRILLKMQVYCAVGIGASH